MSMVRRHAIYFSEDDHVTGLSVYASDDVIALLRSCLSSGSMRAEPNGHIILPIEEAAKAAKWAGGFSATTSPDHAATNAIYECLVYGVFNCFWENGLDGALRAEASW